MRRLHLLLTVGLVCVVIGTALILFAALWNPGSPPVEVVLSQSGAQVFKGAYFDAIHDSKPFRTKCNRSCAGKDGARRLPAKSAPVTVCGQCRTIVRIEEVQPTPDMNLDYYQGAIGSPEYIHVRYGPTLLSNIASSALPSGLSVAAVGFALLIYRRTGKR